MMLPSEDCYHGSMGTVAKKQTNVRLPEDLLRRLRVAAAERGVSQNLIVEEALVAYLDAAET